MRGEVGKETPKKMMYNRRIFMTSHMTLFAVPSKFFFLIILDFYSTLKLCIDAEYDPEVEQYAQDTLFGGFWKTMKKLLKTDYLS